MLGAIIGDIIGSAYEFHNTKDYDFELMTRDSDYTDDSILTVAVAEWLMDDPTHSETTLVDTLVRFGKRFPHPVGGYGGGFSTWLFHPECLEDYDGGFREGATPQTGDSLESATPQTGVRHPYHSWGNGSAMRVSAIGWYFDTLEETEKVAAISAKVTHDHPEGIKGAQAVAAAIFLARTHSCLPTGSASGLVSGSASGLVSGSASGKEVIRKYITERYGYDLSRSWDELHRTYDWDSSCQGTVPEAIICFLESTDYLDAIRKAVSIGGDSDTIACITGGIAEAYYGPLSGPVKEIAFKHLHHTLIQVYWKFTKTCTCFGSFLHPSGDGHVILSGPSDRVTLSGHPSASSGSDRVTPSGHPSASSGFDRVTPSKIIELEPGQIFVFGSNVHGLHGGGAARFALDHFGAEWGNGEGLQGRSYALPTMEGLDNTQAAINRFTAYARLHPEFTFLVTPVGCGIAGFTPAEIAPFFEEASHLTNVWLPRSFWNVLR